MTGSLYFPPQVRDDIEEQNLLERALARAAGAPLIEGNDVRLLKDATENYPAWLAAIHSAERTIYFESYIIHEDDSGRRFADALAAKAAEGVQVRLLYDWLGAVGKSSSRFWRDIAATGVEVRCYNPPHFSSPFGWLQRDHRKSLSVDGRVGFISGLCVGRMWEGDPVRNIPPWRDTGTEIRGPAVADIDSAFAQVWAACGPPIPQGEMVPRDRMTHAGSVTLRVVATTPGTSGLFRLDQIIAAGAQRTLWIADAYFAATPPYMQALRAAAMDGVDVRLLVPGATDIPILRMISQSGYRPLLESGVRVFEWKGPMMHAKTAVADARWARVGSSNLNIASWLGNCELDAVIEDESFAVAMERSYLDDLENATEIVLKLTPRGHSRVVREPSPAQASDAEPAHIGQGSGSSTGSAGRIAAGALRVGNAVGAAIADRRVLTPTEARILGPAGIVLLAIAVLAIIWPLVVAVPIALLAAWFGLAMLARAYSLRRE